MAYVRDPSTGVEIAALMDLFTLLKTHKIAGKSEADGVHIRNRSLVPGLNDDLDDVFNAMGIGRELYPARLRFTTHVGRTDLMLGL